jgi:hypothetical protein
VERGVRVTGAAPVAAVWERYAVPARWAGWAPHLRGVEMPGDTRGGRIAPGLGGRVRGPLGLRVTFVVADVDERRRTWSWDVRLGPLRMHLRHGVDPDPGGAATWLAVRGPAPVVLAYLPVARVALRRLVRP